MADTPCNVLFLCTGNSARSIMAEAILNHRGQGRFRAFSAGSYPKGQIHPEALRLLRTMGYDVSGLRSKPWTEFAGPNAVPLKFIFTVCDNAAGEACPIWPSKPATAHWGIPDPAAATPAEAPRAFMDAYLMLEKRIEAFIALPFSSLDSATLQTKLRDIGRLEGATPKSLS